MTKALRSIALSLLLAGSALCQAAPLVYANTQKPEHPIVQTMEIMAKKLAQSSAQLELQVMHSGQLGSETATVDKVKKNQLDMVGVNLALFANNMHTANLLTLPFLFRSKDHVWKVLQGEIGKRLEKEFSDNNLVLVGYFDSGFRSFYSVNKPIRRLQDFEGMRIRVLGTQIYKDFMAELGAKAVGMPFAETIEALKTGKLDASDNNIVTFVASDHYKYVKYLSLDEHSMVPDVLLMSKQSWAKLTPAQQNELKAAANYANSQLRTMWPVKEQELLAQARKAGVTVIPKEQLSLGGIEGLAYRVYNKHLANSDDLTLIMKISGYID